MRVYDQYGDLLVTPAAGIILTVSGTVDVDTVINPVDVNILSDAAGLATEATLQAIETGIPNALGQATMANSMPVVISSDQSPIAVTGTFTPSGTQDVNIVTDSVGLATEATLLSINTTQIDGTQKTQITDSITDAEVVPLTNFNGLAVAIVDGNGDQITSFGGGVQYVAGAGVVMPTGTLALGYDGSKVKALDVDTGGKLNLNDIQGVISLPTGASTEATLSTLNAKFVSGTDIGDVTINNASGGSAVNIQDGGNSITVDGTVAFSNSSIELGATSLAALELIGIKGADGSTISSNSNPVPISDAGGIITVDGTVILGAGAAVIGHVIVDSGSITVTQATGTNLHTVIDSGTITTVSTVTSITNPVTVSANNLDIRDLVFATDKVDASGTVLGAGTNNIGDVDVLTLPAEGTISTVNSSTTPLTTSGVFTGTLEDITNYSAATINVYTDVDSAIDGLSIQQSSDGTNWDIKDIYSVPAFTGKTFGIQCTAKYFRIVYTNGLTAQGAFRLQVIFHKYEQRTSSIRPQDNRSNDNDMTETVAYAAGFNGTSWDRLRSTTTYGLQVDVTRIAYQDYNRRIQEEQVMRAYLQNMIGMEETEKASGGAYGFELR